MQTEKQKQELELWRKAWREYHRKKAELEHQRKFCKYMPEFFYVRLLEALKRGESYTVPVHQIEQVKARSAISGFLRRKKNMKIGTKLCLDGVIVFKRRSGK